MTSPAKPRSAKPRPAKPKPLRSSSELAELFADARKPERIAKRLARAGLCSRRDAERWIADDRVSVDGTVLDSPAVTVTESSVILVDGNPIPTIEQPRLWRYHKARGTVTTNRDPEGRRTVFDTLPADLPRVVSVGRLDVDSEGLLLLTNDGALARHLELPSTGWTRRYRVRVFGALDEAALAALKRGITVDGTAYGPIEVSVDRASRTNSWLTVGLREGKNREIRRLMEHLGLTVSRLIRVSYGPFQLGDIAPGAVEEVKTRVLKGQLGLDHGDSECRAKAKPKRTGTRPPTRTDKAAKTGKRSDSIGSKTSDQARPGKREARHADRRRKAPRR